MQNQIDGQVTLYELFSENASLGFIDEKNVGIPLNFSQLKDYVGKKIVCESITGSGADSKIWHKVILLTNYYEGCDQWYTDGKEYHNEYYFSICGKERAQQLKKAFKCDRIGYTDDKRTKKENSWISEAFCVNGRFPSLGYAGCPPVQFYEYKAA